MEPRLSADFKPQPDDVQPDITLDSRVIMKGNTQQSNNSGALK